MDQALAKEFHFGQLIKFTLPSIIMMIFMSLYTIVDGVFVSRFVDTNALSAVNIVFPVSSVIIGFSIMLATGGSAIIARKMGEGKTEEARSNFSLIVLVGVAVSLVVSLIGILFLEPICYALGASELLIDYAKEYLFILLLFAPASVLQMLFQVFFITAGKPGLGLFLTVLAGFSNAILDYVFIVPMNMGISGAALATASGYLIPAVTGICFFFSKKSPLYFSRPRFNKTVLLQSCMNGSSEMVTNLSSAIITFLFNIIMMNLLGEDGVAAITIVLYGQFLLTALFMGFSMGVSPILSFNYGCQNHERLTRLFRTCIRFILISSLVIFVLSLLFSKGLVGIFAPSGSRVFSIAHYGFCLFSISYLFAGVNIFASALFTSLSDGKRSALISFLRTFGCILPGVLLFPALWKESGVWIAVPIAELITLLVSVVCLLRWLRRTKASVKDSTQLPSKTGYILKD